MGLLNKFKNMFTEEIEDEVEEPIKKEMIKVEIPAPTKVEKQEKQQVEVKKASTDKVEIEKEFESEPKKEEKFSFPVFFDDDDFKELEKKEEKKVERKIEPYKGALKEPKKEEPTKKFKPTPVISPVYGVLDKNYKKEDITTREKISDSKYSKGVSLDDIRKKAYGTLEDELERGLLNDTVYDRPAAYRDEMDMFSDLNDFDEDFDLSDERIEENSTDFEENQLKSNTIKSRLKEEGEEKEQTKDSTDLFNLIDSMYKEGE